MVRLTGLALSFVLSACVTTAGPFITHIEAAGPGALRVTKCTVEQTRGGGFISDEISTGACTIEMVWLGGPPGQEAPPQRR
jgi:hypothetical protein